MYAHLTKVDDKEVVTSTPESKSAGASSSPSKLGLSNEFWSPPRILSAIIILSSKYYNK